MIQPDQMTFYLFTDEEIQTIIREHFGRSDYNLLLTEEWHTECDYQFQGVKRSAYNASDREEVGEFRFHGGTPPAFVTLLCALVNEEKIPEGNYLISVA